MIKRHNGKELKRFFILLCLIMVFVNPVTAFSGKLDDFEKDATKHKKKRSHRDEIYDDLELNQRRSDQTSIFDDTDSSVKSCILGMIFSELVRPKKT